MAMHNSNFALGRYRFAQSKSDSRFGQDRASLIGPLLHRFFKNGLILTLSALAMRIVGVSFNSFITSKVGADGIGLYTLIMSVYGFSVTVASSGVHLATTPALCRGARPGRICLPRCGAALYGRAAAGSR